MSASEQAALVIEDDLLVAWATSELVAKLGYDPVMVATTGEGAWEAMRGGDVGLIVCDIDLGSMSPDGLEVLQSIDPEERVPTVIHTALDVTKMRNLSNARTRAVAVHKLADPARLRDAIRIVQTRAAAEPSHQYPPDGLATQPLHKPRFNWRSAAANFLEAAASLGSSHKPES